MIKEVIFVDGKHYDTTGLNGMHLEIGKRYIAQFGDWLHSEIEIYSIYSIDGHKYGNFHRSMFMDLEEWREQQIDKILNE